MGIELGNIPPPPTPEQKNRMQLLVDIERWEAHDQEVAKSLSTALIKMVSTQFGINLMQVE